MSSLLNKTRMLNKILQKSGTEPVAFQDICALLSEVLECNAYIISKKGKVLGYTFGKDFECEAMKKKVIAFIRENGIAYGLTGYPTKATIFYNDYFKSWQLTLERGREEDHIWYKDAANETDMIVYARKFINVEGWGQRKAQTGIKVWEAVF